MVVISVPAIFSCPISRGRWINLAAVRQVHFYKTRGSFLSVVTWSNGQVEQFSGPDAEAILTAWKSAHERFTSWVQSSEGE